MVGSAPSGTHTPIQPDRPHARATSMPCAPPAPRRLLARSQQSARAVVSAGISRGSCVIPPPGATSPVGSAAAQVSGRWPEEARRKRRHCWPRPRCARSRALTADPTAGSIVLVQFPPAPHLTLLTLLTLRACSRRQVLLRRARAGSAGHDRGAREPVPAPPTLPQGLSVRFDSHPSPPNPTLALLTLLTLRARSPRQVLLWRARAGRPLEGAGRASPWPRH